jgi:hypothetical protein
MSFFILSLNYIITNMKKITINGIDLLYETFCDSNEYDDYFWTGFYHPTEKVQIEERKYVFFGKKTVTEVPKLLFKIYEDSNDQNLSKAWWRKRIENELDLLNREQELENGELI